MQNPCTVSVELNPCINIVTDCWTFRVYAVMVLRYDAAYDFLVLFYLSSNMSKLAAFDHLYYNTNSELPPKSTPNNVCMKYKRG